MIQNILDQIYRKYYNSLPLSQKQYVDKLVKYYKYYQIFKKISKQLGMLNIILAWLTGYKRKNITFHILNLFTEF